jgi:hypothetical protein
VPLPSLTANVDHLAELRGLIRQAQDEERRITADVLSMMQAAGLDRLEGREAVAVRDSRTTLKPDPELFHTALGAPAFGAMTVSVTAARRLLGEDELAAISETTTTPVLRVEPLTNGKAVA